MSHDHYFVEACKFYTLIKLILTIIVSTIVVMYLLRLLVLLGLAAIAVGLSCNPVSGDHSDCACTMDDGSGTVDISSYAKTDKTSR